MQKPWVAGLYLDYAVDPSFQGVNTIFVLSFKNDWHWTSYKQYLLHTVGVKDSNVVIDGQTFFDQPVKNDQKTYNIRKIMTGQKDDYKTACLLGHIYFKYYYKMIETDLNKQALDADLKEIQQINFTGSLDQARSKTKFFVIEEIKETIWDFSQGTVRVL